MTDAASPQKETFTFQTEVKQLLHLMIHSLYSNKEIFLRELISNASDAQDKLRFEALNNKELMADDADLKITLKADKEAKTLTISDNGIGMTRDEVIENLGTIAKSGTKAFIENLSGDQAKDSQLIGQFGVGFYSAFMVADKVTVITRKAGSAADEAVRWESQGDGAYTLETATKATRGTDVILHLKPAEENLLDNWKLRSLVSKYSDHISFPIEMEKAPEFDKDGKEKPATGEMETVNQATALWTRPRNEITDEEYKEFYKHVAHDYQDPLDWIHAKVEGNQEFTTLLYVPQTAPFDLWDRERKSGLKLYIKRVFIMDNAEFLPNYLRFVKGVVDAADLPLNVSREILQDSKQVNAIKASVVKRTLTMLKKMAESQPENYAKFWKAFGQVLKEGPGEDFENKEKIAELLRFSSTLNDSEEQTVSLKDYVSRMKEKQEHIYYVTADNFNAAKNSPHLEMFRKKGIEVLLLSERVDEWLVSMLTDYDGKKLQSVSKGVVDLDSDKTEEEKAQEEQVKKNFESILADMKKALDEKVKDVRITHRLTDSPSCVVAEEEGMSLHLQRIMAQAGQAVPPSKPVLEINPEHQLVARLKEVQDDESFKEWSLMLFEQAVIADGGQLDDPVAFVKRMNKLLSH